MRNNPWGFTPFGMPQGFRPETGRSQSPYEAPTRGGAIDPGLPPAQAVQPGMPNMRSQQPPQPPMQMPPQNMDWLNRRAQLGGMLGGMQPGAPMGPPGGGMMYPGGNPNFDESRPWGPGNGLPAMGRTPEERQASRQGLRQQARRDLRQGNFDPSQTHPAYQQAFQNAYGRQRENYSGEKQNQYDSLVAALMGGGR